MSAFDKWREASFAIGVKEEGGYGTREQKGHVYRGVGLHEHGPDEWTLTHLNSGHAAAYSSGEFAEVILGATKIAEAVDWNFRAISDWKKQPHFMVRLKNAIRGNWRLIGGGEAKSSEEIASQIASERVP